MIKPRGPHHHLSRRKAASERYIQVLNAKEQIEGSKPTVIVLSSSHNLFDFHNLDLLQVALDSFSFDHVGVVVWSSVESVAEWDRSVVQSAPDKGEIVSRS